MQVCQVVGSVTATAKDERLVGCKLMLVRAGPGTGTEAPFVAVDTVGAGIGDQVLVVSGRAARLTAKTLDMPTDAAIVAIVDLHGVTCAEEAMEGRS